MLMFVCDHTGTCLGSYLVQHASTIRYRKSIDFLVPFKVVTKLVYFDDHALYFEQRFISYPDGFVRAVAICKNTAVKVNIRRLVPNQQSAHPDIIRPRVGE